MSTLILEFTEFNKLISSVSSPLPEWKNKIEQSVMTGGADFLSDYDMKLLFNWGFHYDSYGFENERMSADFVKIANGKLRGYSREERKKMKSEIPKRKLALEILFMNYAAGNPGERLEIRYDEKMQEEFEGSCDFIRDQLEYDMDIKHFIYPKNILPTYFSIRILVVYEPK